MQTSRSKTNPHYTFTDSSIPVMLRSTKALLSHDRNIARLEKQIERKNDLIERLLNTYLPTNSAAAE